MKLDIGTLALVGVVGYLAYRWTRADIPNSTEVATSAFWNSSFGDLATVGVDAWGNGWSWSPTPYSENEAEEIARVAENINRRMGWDTGSLGSL